MNELDYVMKFGRQHTRIIGAALVVAMLGPLVGCRSNDKAAAGPDISALSSKAQVDCAFDGADQLVNTPTCYEVTVPEDWTASNADDPVVLTVAIFSSTETGKSSDADPPAPMIYLNGGPGGEALDTLQYSEADLVTPYVADRDVIIYDQRGVGPSQPNLDCPEADEVSLAKMTGEIDQSDYVTDYYGALTACHDRLTDDGANLAAYNSIASVRDLEAIRTQLGYKQFNLLGTSYGTRLAQTYMRLYPASLHSVAIDSVMPVEANVNEQVSVTAKRSFEVMFAACADDPACSAAYPTFENDLFDLIDEFDATPAEVEVVDGEGNDYTFFINGDAFIEIVFSGLYDKEGFQAFPQMVAQAKDGNYDLIGHFATVNLIGGSFLSTGMYLSVFCNEEVPFDSAERMEAQVPTDGNYRRFDFFAQAPSDFSSCAYWSAGKAPDVENEPVDSDLPTLVMAGTFDPITPPSYAQQVADHLANSYLFEFPTEGHGVSSNECGSSIVAAFFNDPSQRPDGSCIAEVPAPQWVPADPIFVSFEMADSPLTGLRPDGWTEDAPGVFSRKWTPVDPTALVVQPADGRPTDEVLSAFDTDLESVDPTDIDGEQWETFAGEYNDNPVRLMISPNNEFFVYVGTAPGEIDDLVESVAVPVAESLRIG